MTQKSVVEDIGGHHGIIFSESGFQSGAQEASRQSNITLVSSLEDFRKTASIRRHEFPLLSRPSDEANAPPHFEVPQWQRPQSLVLEKEVLFVGDLEGGTITLVDPGSRKVTGIVQLDRYERESAVSRQREIVQFPPGSMAVADGKLFVGQVFSDFLLVIDIKTQSIVRRIPISGGGEGAIASSSDGRLVFFASNRVNQFFVVDTATYTVNRIDYPPGGRGCLCVLPHPERPLLFLGIQRGPAMNPASQFAGNCFLATFDLTRGQYTSCIYLAELINGRSDDSMPACLTFDHSERCLYVGMFQSKKGIYKVSENGAEILGNLTFEPNTHNASFSWVDPLSQAIYGDKLLSVNRNNLELVIVDRKSLNPVERVYLGRGSNGPSQVVTYKDEAIIVYPARKGLIFHKLS